MNFYTLMESPLGPISLHSDGTAVTGLYMAGSGEPPVRGEAGERRTAGVHNAAAGPLPEAVLQLNEYFAGRRKDFDLPMRLIGTEFQLRVWAALCEIPYGVTWSYGQLAERIQNPKACRAVGLANGRNPISILVPCHRVIGANGTLTGYGGGIDRKRWLLTHEGRGPFELH